MAALRIDHHSLVAEFTLETSRSRVRRTSRLKLLSKDPILFEGNQNNLFSYVNSDPLNLIDPQGTRATFLEPIQDIDLGGGGGAIEMGCPGGAIAGATILDLLIRSNQKGERNKTAKPDGTDNPYKHMKPNPDNPNEIKGKDPHTGKTVKRPMTDEFKRWWNGKHPDKKIP